MQAWGVMPGTLNYTFTRELYLFSIEDSTTSSHINMTSVGPISYKVERTFKNPTYDNARKVINYTMEYEY